MSYKTMRLYEEIKTEMQNVIDAEQNAAAWKAEARNRMKDVTSLVIAAKKVNKEIEIDVKSLISEVREDIAAEAEEPVDDTATEDDNGETPEENSATE